MTLFLSCEKTHRINTGAKLGTYKSVHPITENKNRDFVNQYLPLDCEIESSQQDRGYQKKKKITNWHVLQKYSTCFASKRQTVWFFHNVGSAIHRIAQNAAQKFTLRFDIQTTSPIQSISQGREIERNSKKKAGKCGSRRQHRKGHECWPISALIVSLCANNQVSSQI